MENKILILILIMILLIGIISIGYLIVKIIPLIRTHLFVKTTLTSSPNFQFTANLPSKDFNSDESDLTVIVDFNEVETLPAIFFKFSKIAGLPSERIEILRKENIILGRATDVDIFIDDKTVSRRHLQFLFKNGKLQILDLDTFNGTTLNNKKLTPMIPYPILSKSLIKIGSTSFFIDINI